MSILVACPTRGRIWYETAMSLAELAHAPEVGDVVYLQNNRSVIEARNEVVQTFLDTPHDALLMIDDDIIPNPDVLDLVTTLNETEGAGIVGAPCPILLPGLPVLANIFSINEETHEFAVDMSVSINPTEERVVKVDAIGFGAVAISRSLAESQPEFQIRSDEYGNAYMGEDIDYCVRAASIGYSTHAAIDLLCDHRIEIHAAGVAKMIADFLDKANEY